MQLAYKLQHLSCSLCATAVQHAVATVPGVEKATADFPTNRLIVEGANLNSMDIITAVRESGSDIVAEEDGDDIDDGEHSAHCSSDHSDECSDASKPKLTSQQGAKRGLTTKSTATLDDLCDSDCACSFKNASVQASLPHVYECPEYIKEAEKKLAAHTASEQAKSDKSFWQSEESKEAKVLIFSLSIFVIALLLDNFLPKQENASLIVGASIQTWLIRSLFAVPYIICGLPVFRGAIRAIQNKSIFNEFSLMSIATLAAIGLDQLPEAVGVMLFYCIGEFFQELAVRRSRSSIKSLLASRPVIARVVGTDGSVQERAVESVKPGEDVIVRPGEKIPLDGTIISGQSRIDTSALTGEPKPMSGEPGKQASAGYINLDAVVTLKVTQAFKDSEIARILLLTEKAAQRKAPAERFGTRFAKIYTPIVVVLAVLVACLPPLLLGAAWNEWIYRALVLLVISCPCALVISIPLSYFGGIGAASQHGILVKGGLVLDALKNIDMVVFDKTGTLTEGIFEVTAISVEPDSTEAELLRAAALAEMESNHPVARSIMTKVGTIARPEDFEAEELAGRGMKVTVGGEIYLAGNARLLQEMNIEFKENNSPQGTVIYVAANGKYLGSILVSDRLRPESVSAIAELKKRGLKTYMLSGDRPEGVAWVAKAVGIDGYKAGLLPTQKVDALDELTKPGTPARAAFVGDGVNDAPILAVAGIGISMGGTGSEVAVEASDVVLQNDSPAKVVKLFDLAKKVRGIVWQNIILALGIKIIFMSLGIVGLSGLWEAVFADVGVALIAALNASRAMRV